MAGPFGYFSPGPITTAGGVQSGAVTSGGIADGAVTSGSYASGSISRFKVASGSFLGFELGSGAIVSGRIASGQIGRYHLESGCIIDHFACEQAISGVLAVAWGSGGCFLVPAERQSGLRLPAVGVVAGNFVSGDIVPVVRRGRIGVTASGAIASGMPGKYLYVGSGGLLVSLSGFVPGASSGTGPNPVLNTGEISGSLVQRIAVLLSGGLDVIADSNVTSGLYSGSLGAF